LKFSLKSIVFQVYYDLDSKSDRSKLIGDEEKLRQYLDSLLKSKDKELFIVVGREVFETESWKILPETDDKN
jgi:hypothetical protein